MTNFIGTNRNKPPYKININHGTYYQLINLPGISDITAAKIILYREKHGAYLTLDDLLPAVGRTQAWLDPIRHRLEV